jgi:hypothetical protein
MKTLAADALKAKGNEIREAIGPEKIEPVKQAERAFGREGAQDVKKIVWTGHTVISPRGHSYYGAVGLTKQGYYRTAEVQVYGTQEKWRWEGERFMKLENAVGKAEANSAMRLKGVEWGKAYQPPKW